jgi:hypothetical protein
MLTSAGAASAARCQLLSRRRGAVAITRTVVAIGCGMVSVRGGPAAGP